MRIDYNFLYLHVTRTLTFGDQLTRYNANSDYRINIIT